MQVNTFAEIVAGWVGAWGERLPFVRRRQADGEFLGVLRAPRGSKAGALAVSTWRGDLWVRLLKPNAWYPVESRQELSRVVRALVSERALFATTYREGAWQAVTLVPRAFSLKARHGEVVQVVSWSGRFDRTIAGAKPTRTFRRARKSERAG